MLLDCAKLQHWRVEHDFGLLFEAKRDYRDWMWLLLEPQGSVGELESVWNDFDNLTPQTKMLHNTHRRTQPWKTGLPVAEFPLAIQDRNGLFCKAERRRRWPPGLFAAATFRAALRRMDGFHLVLGAVGRKPRLLGG